MLDHHMPAEKADLSRVKTGRVSGRLDAELEDQACRIVQEDDNLIAGDSRLMTALMRIFYGLFQKQFDFAVDLDMGKEAT